MSMNIGFLFNKKLFQQLHNKPQFIHNVKQLQAQILNAELEEQTCNLLDIKKQIPDNNIVQTIELKTAWPGLLIGLGYGHSVGGTEEEFKNGFYFDFTSGMPVLPGSSVKGMLRSFFPGRYEKDKQQLVANRLISILKELEIKSEWDLNSLIELESAIFAGKWDTEKYDTAIQDIFLEAFPVHADPSKVVENIPFNNGNRNNPERILAKHQIVEKENLFLGEDHITPHQHPLKNPLPLKLLKIRPGVTIKFQFILNNIGLNIEDKEKLFRELLLRYGVGAKNSVGFGKLIAKEGEIFSKNSNEEYLKFSKSQEMSPEDDREHKEGEKINEIQTQEKVEEIKISESDDWLLGSQVSKGSVIPATVIAVKDGNIKIQLHIKGYNMTQSIPGKEEIGTVIQVKVLNVEGKAEKNNLNFKVYKIK